MEDLINTINKLQDVFSASGCQGMDLPQIVVVGSQSAGKSSVLEHLVGKSFLPRGLGVVTRCPLVLQLVHAQTNTEEDYAIFQHNKSKIFTDFMCVCKEIYQQTIRLAGDKKNICDTPINLKIFSSSFLNLTLVDLPGLTLVPVGEQPPDIDQQTRELTLRYIGNPNCIILALTPANVDMATSESLKMAREVDPQGKRTLAVVTKLDLMDVGTDAWDILTGKIIPVKLGIIGVVNRSQKDIMDEKSIEQSLKDEAEFFNKNYRRLAGKHGSPYLKKTVQTILVNHVRNCLPKLKERISQKLTNQRSELRNLGDGRLDKPALLLDLMTKFSSNYTSAIKGDLSNIQTKELHGGARINYVFQESLSNALYSINPLSNLSRGAILTAMQNASGVSPALFVPEVAFELLVKKQIQRLREPCHQCVEIVHEEMNKIVQNCIEDTELGLNKYPKLQQEMQEVLTELLLSRVPITNQMVDHFIDVQLAYINTSHPDFLSNSTHIPSTMPVNLKDQPLCLTENPYLPMASQEGNRLIASNPSQSLDKSTQDYLLIQELILSYFSIVRKTVQDLVPKIIMHFLVNYAVDHLQLELVARLYKSDTGSLLQESQEVSEMRKDITAAISTLEEANSIINNLAPSVIRNCYHLEEKCSLELAKTSTLEISKLL